MIEIKFRQGIFLDGKFLSWHYWGIGADDTFKGPVRTSGEKFGDSFQYTGLKDKSGKEIWEGDIIKGIHQHKGQSEVFYEYGQWQPFSYLGDYTGNDFEVIGNIYQNPEL